MFLAFYSLNRPNYYLDHELIQVISYRYTHLVFVALVGATVFQKT